MANALAGVRGGYEPLPQNEQGDVNRGWKLSDREVIITSLFILTMVTCSFAKSIYIQAAAVTATLCVATSGVERTRPSDITKIACATIITVGGVLGVIAAASDKLGWMVFAEVTAIASFLYLSEADFPLFSDIR